MVMAAVKYVVVINYGLYPSCKRHQMTSQGKGGSMYPSLWLIQVFPGMTSEELESQYPLRCSNVAEDGWWSGRSSKESHEEANLRYVDWPMAK